MGLDIIAYSKLEKLKDEDIEQGKYKNISEDRVVTFFTNPDFPYHSHGIDFGTYYMVKGEKYDFRAGSYSGYNEWRDWLSKVAGFQNAHEVWNKKPIGPFVELINFSDSDGTIGATVAAKLAKDFKEYEEQAKSLKDSIYLGLERYYEWKKACEIASKKGAIKFA